MLIALVFLAIIVAGGLFWRSATQVPESPRPSITDDEIKLQWRKLGFFCELDDQKRVWILTGSRAGLLYFPDLLLGYIADPQNAKDGEKKHYGPYGSLEVMTYPEAGFDAHHIRGSLTDLARLAEIVEEKLTTAEPGELIRIRDEYAAHSPYGLTLDVRTDGFDPASTDRERLGAATKPPEKPPAPDKK